MMTQEFHLVQDDILDRAGTQSGQEEAAPEAEPDVLVVPHGISSPIMDASGDIRDFSIGGAPRNTNDSFMLEPIFGRDGAVLVVISPEDRRAVANGLPIPRFATLTERDLIQLPPSPRVYHLCVYAQPNIGPPSEGFVGQECPLCRQTITANTTVYHCNCGRAALHLEPEAAGKDRLQCALEASVCLHCKRPVVTVEGYRYLPGAKSYA